MCTNCQRTQHTHITEVSPIIKPQCNEMTFSGKCLVELEKVLLQTCQFHKHKSPIVFPTGHELEGGEPSYFGKCLSNSVGGEVRYSR